MILLFWVICAFVTIVPCCICCLYQDRQTKRLPVASKSLWNCILFPFNRLRTLCSKKTDYVINYPEILDDTQIEIDLLNLPMISSSPLPEETPLSEPRKTSRPRPSPRERFSYMTSLASFNKDRGLVSLEWQVEKGLFSNIMLTSRLHMPNQTAKLYFNPRDNCIRDEKHEIVTSVSPPGQSVIDSYVAMINSRDTPKLARRNGHITLESFPFIRLVKNQYWLNEKDGSVLPGIKIPDFPATESC